MLADWQLPHGVSRGLWDSCRDPATARAYDAALQGTPLTAIDQQFVLKHCQPPGRLIDLGCGTGRLVLMLAQLGYQPLAVDLSPEMLKVLGEKATALGLEIPRLCANLADLGALADESFDHAACLFSTLGLVSGVAARRCVLQHTHRLLRPGGIFALHVHNRWFQCWTKPGRRFLARNALDSWLGRGGGGDYEMPPHHDMGRLTMHLFTRREAVAELHASGFEILTVLPVSLRTDSRLRCPWWCGWLRSYGYLLAARKRGSMQSV